MQETPGKQEQQHLLTIPANVCTRSWVEKTCMSSKDWQRKAITKENPEPHLRWISLSHTSVTLEESSHLQAPLKPPRDTSWILPLERCLPHLVSELSEQLAGHAFKKSTMVRGVPKSTWLEGPGQSAFKTKPCQSCPAPSETAQQPHTDGKFLNLPGDHKLQIVLRAVAPQKRRKKVGD